jgi:hypothetical protein
MNGINMLIVVLALTASVAHAQTKVDSLVTTEEPLQNDKYATEVPKDSPPYKNQIEVAREDIPVRLLKTLQRDDLYKGWENSTIYLDENTHIYMLRMKRNSTITTYGFNKNGKAVTFDSFTQKE